MNKEFQKVRIARMILRLEDQQVQQGKYLRNTLSETIDSYSPAGLIHQSIDALTTSTDVKKGLMATAGGMLVGALSKFLLIGNSHNPVKRVVGNLTQVGVTLLVTKHPNTLLAVVGGLVKLVKAVRSKYAKSTEVYPLKD